MLDAKIDRLLNFNGTPIYDWHLSMSLGNFQPKLITSLVSIHLSNSQPNSTIISDITSFIVNHTSKAELIFLYIENRVLSYQRDQIALEEGCLLEWNTKVGHRVNQIGSLADTVGWVLSNTDKPYEPQDFMARKNVFESSLNALCR